MNILCKLYIRLFEFLKSHLDEKNKTIFLEKAKKHTKSKEFHYRMKCMLCNESLTVFEIEMTLKYSHEHKAICERCISESNRMLEQSKLYEKLHRLEPNITILGDETIYEYKIDGVYHNICTSLPPFQDYNTIINILAYSVTRQPDMQCNENLGETT